MKKETADFANPDTVRRIIDSCRTIAVVGLSGNSSRPSHQGAA
jgi:predicted CoA-binding protein